MDGMTEKVEIKRKMKRRLGRNREEENEGKRKGMSVVKSEKKQ